MSGSAKYLIPVGFYREFRGGKPHEPSLREVVQVDAQPEDGNIVRYLKMGKVLIATGGVVGDVLDVEHGIIGAPHILTDATYAWPAILAHYVEHHHIRLPDEFVSHMARNGWEVPSTIDLHELRIDRDR